MGEGWELLFRSLALRTSASWINKRRTTLRRNALQVKNEKLIVSGRFGTFEFCFARPAEGILHGAQNGKNPAFLQTLGFKNVGRRGTSEHRLTN